MGLPQDFDWKAYLILNPDVAKVSCTEQFARKHWLRAGALEGRKYKTEVPSGIQTERDVWEYISKNKKAPSLAVFFHCGNFDLWPEFKGYIDNVISSGYKTQLYVSYQKDHDVLKEMKQRYPGVITVQTSRGCDIGGFLNMMHLAKGKGHDYVLFLHTKTDPRWRRAMTDPIVNSPEKIHHVCDIFDKNINVGIVGCKKWALNIRTCRYNHPILRQYSEKFGLNYERTHFHFLGGTIFWTRWSIWEKFFEEKKVDLLAEYELLEPQYMKNLTPTNMHSWERLFGLVVNYYGGGFFKV